MVVTLLFRNRRKYLLIFRSLHGSSEEPDKKHHPLESRQTPQNSSSNINSTHWVVMGFPLGSKTIFLWMLHKRNSDAQVKYAINIQSNDHCDISSRITHNYKIISLLYSIFKFVIICVQGTLKALLSVCPGKSNKPYWFSLVFPTLCLFSNVAGSQKNEVAKCARRLNF